MVRGKERRIRGKGEGRKEEKGMWLVLWRLAL